MKLFTLRSALPTFFSSAIITNCQKTAISPTTVNIFSQGLSHQCSKVWRKPSFISSTFDNIDRPLKNAMAWLGTNIVLRQKKLQANYFR